MNEQEIRSSLKGTGYKWKTFSKWWGFPSSRPPPFISPNDLKLFLKAKEAGVTKEQLEILGLM